MWLLLFAGIRINDAEENSRVNAGVNALERASGDHDVFWREPAFARLIVKFRDRVQQVQNFFETCRDNLAMVLETMLPLNARPTSLIGLLREFRDPSRFKLRVRDQMLAGAKAALAFSIARYTRLNLMEIANGPPVDADGLPMEMTIPYVLAEDPAKIIIDKVEAETAAILQERAEAADK